MNGAQEYDRATESSGLVQPSLNISEDHWDSIVVGINLDVVRLNFTEHQSEKPIVRDATFRADSGRVTALMGDKPKTLTTLLEVISLRRQQGRYSGEVLVSGMPRGDYFVHNTAYVPSQALYLPGLSYEETLRYAAELRMGKGSTREHVDQRVNNVLEIMDLQWCRSERVESNTSRGVRGGQLKRLSIAVELTGMPSLVFLEDPVVQLDSAVAVDTMHHLKLLAQRQHTVICTLTHPAPEVFASVDSIILMSGARVIYAGDAARALTYFSNPDLGYVLDSKVPPAEFLLDIACARERPQHQRWPLSSHELASRFHTSPLYRMPTRELQDRGSIDIISYPFTTKPTPLGKQIRTLFRRTMLSTLRQPRMIFRKMMQCILFGVIFGVLQEDQGNLPRYLTTVMDSPYRKVSNCTAAVFYVVVFATSVHLPAIEPLAQRLRLFHFEHLAGSCDPLAFWLASFFSDLPIYLFALLFYTNIVFALMNFEWVFKDVLFVNILESTVCVFGWLLASCLAALTLDENRARDLYMLCLVPQILLSGFPAAFKKIEGYWEHVSRANPLRWAYEAIFVWALRGHPDSDEYMAKYSFDNSNRYTALLYLCFFVAAALVLYYICLLPKPTKLIHFKWTLHEARPTSRESSEDATQRLSQPFLLRKVPSVTSGSESDHGSEGDTEVGAGGQGPHIYFRRLRYSIPQGPCGLDKPKHILHSVTGKISPGHLTAIMGLTGSGKSALLETLAGHTPPEYVQGDVLFNNSPMTQRVRKQIAYVMDADVQFPGLTVRDTVHYAALLRCDEAMQEFSRSIHINRALDMVSLKKLADKCVKDLTLGERRRLSIAEEAVTLPSVLFLDEPTTDLEMHDMVDVVNCLRDLVFESRTVVASIHKPPEMILDMFDEIILLANGRIVFTGPPEGCVSFFRDTPLCFIMAPGKNPADFIVDAAGGLVDNSSGEIITPERLEDVWTSSQLYTQIHDEVMAIEASGAEKVQNLGFWNWGVYPRNISSATWILLKRQVVRVASEYDSIFRSTVYQVLAAAFVGWVYWNQRSTQYNSTAAMYLTLLAALGFAGDLGPHLWLSRRVFFKEHKNGLYPAFAHWALSIFPITIVRVLQTCALGFIIRSMVQHQNQESVVLNTWYLFMLYGAICVFLADVFVNLASTLSVVYVILPGFAFLNLCFSGTMVQIPTMPDWMKIGPKISVLRWCLQFLVKNEYAEDRETFPNVYDDDGELLVSGDVSYNNFIDTLGFEFRGIWFCFHVLVYYCICARVAVLIPMLFAKTKTFNQKVLPPP